MAIKRIRAKELTRDNMQELGDSILRLLLLMMASRDMTRF
jgi:hypothetical protein